MFAIYNKNGNYIGIIDNECMAIIYVAKNGGFAKKL